MSKKKKCHYEIQSFSFDSPSLKKKLNRKKMIKFSKSQLSVNHRMDLDKSIKSKDLNDKKNAWLYLKNIGLGLKTNCKS